MRQETKEVLGPWAVATALGASVALILNLVGVLSGLDGALRDAMASLAGAQLTQLAPPVVAILAVAITAAVVLAMMLSPGQLRRALLLVTSVILTFGAMVSFALWGVYLSPLVIVAGILWGGLCGLFYCMNHPLPCDRIEAAS